MLSAKKRWSAAGSEQALRAKVAASKNTKADSDVFTQAGIEKSIHFLLAGKDLPAVIKFSAPPGIGFQQLRIRMKFDKLLYLFAVFNPEYRACCVQEDTPRFQQWPERL